MFHKCIPHSPIAHRNKQVNEGTSVVEWAWLSGKASTTHKTLDSLPNTATEEKVWECNSVIECLPIMHKTLSPVPSNRKSQNTAIKLILNCYRSQFLVSAYFSQVCYQGGKSLEETISVGQKPNQKKWCLFLFLNYTWYVNSMISMYTFLYVCMYMYTYLIVVNV